MKATVPDEPPEDKQALGIPIVVLAVNVRLSWRCAAASRLWMRRAGMLEIDRVVQTHKSGCAVWNVAHSHSNYRSEFQGTRSYSRVKTVLQGAGLVKKAKTAARSTRPT